MKQETEINENEKLGTENTLDLGPAADVGLRCVGIPVCAVGVYYGVDRADFRRYMAGSVLGLMPMMIP